MSDCLFCRMIRGEIKAQVAYDDQEIFAIHDINPQAPVHVLVIPKKHIDRISRTQTEDITLLGRMIYRAKLLAAENRWNDFRLVFNDGAEAGQSVFHIHLHLLSGRAMGWPPG